MSEYAEYLPNIRGISTINLSPIGFYSSRFQVPPRDRQPQHQEHIRKLRPVAVRLQPSDEGPHQGQRDLRRAGQGGVLQDDRGRKGEVRRVRQFQPGYREEASHTFRHRREQQMVAEPASSQRTGIRICDHHARFEAGEWAGKTYFTVKRFNQVGSRSYWRRCPEWSDSLQKKLMRSSNMCTNIAQAFMQMNVALASRGAMGFTRTIKSQTETLLKRHGND